MCKSTFSGQCLLHTYNFCRYLGCSIAFTSLRWSKLVWWLLVKLVYQSFCHAGVMNTNHKSVAGFLFSRRRPWLHYTQTQLKLYLNFSVISLFDSNRNMRWLSLFPKPISMCFPVTGWEKFHSPVHNDKYLVIGQVLDNRTFCSVLVSRPMRFLSINIRNCVIYIVL